MAARQPAQTKDWRKHWWKKLNAVVASGVDYIGVANFELTPNQLLGEITKEMELRKTHGVLFVIALHEQARDFTAFRAKRPKKIRDQVVPIFVPRVLVTEPMVFLMVVLDVHWALVARRSALVPPLVERETSIVLVAPITPVQPRQLLLSLQRDHRIRSVSNAYDAKSALPYIRGDGVKRNSPNLGYCGSCHARRGEGVEEVFAQVVCQCGPYMDNTYDFHLNRDLGRCLTCGTSLVVHAICTERHAATFLPQVCLNTENKECMICSSTTHKAVLTLKCGCVVGVSHPDDPCNCWTFHVQSANGARRIGDEEAETVCPHQIAKHQNVSVLPLSCFYITDAYTSIICLGTEPQSRTRTIPFNRSQVAPLGAAVPAIGGGAGAIAATHIATVATKWRDHGAPEFAPKANGTASASTSAIAIGRASAVGIDHVSKQGAASSSIEAHRSGVVAEL